MREFGVCQSLSSCIDNHGVITAPYLTMMETFHHSIQVKNFRRLFDVRSVEAEEKGGVNPARW